MRELPSADAAVVWLVRMQARVKPMMPMDDCDETGEARRVVDPVHHMRRASRWAAAAGSAETTQSPEGVNFRGRRSLAPFCQIIFM